jgi:hypothetical protein
MKKIMLLIIAGSVMAFMLSSCAASKKDCQGVRHYKMKNGIYI